MEPDRTCKRCSMDRVRSLTMAYRVAHRSGGNGALNGLKELVGLATNKGYADGVRLLHPGLTDQDLRALCWNVSSFLEDRDVKRCLAGVLKKPSTTN